MNTIHYTDNEANMERTLETIQERNREDDDMLPVEMHAWHLRQARMARKNAAHHLGTTATKACGTLEAFLRLALAGQWIENARWHLREAASVRRTSLVVLLPADPCQQCISQGRFGPPHHASPGCQSGGHVHCSCDTCF